MNKGMMIGLGILVIILIGGGIFLATQNKKAPIASQQTAVSPAQQQQNIFSSITDALSKNISLSCDFTNQQGTHIVSYIKNGAVRADTTGKTPQESGSVIVKDKKIYFWNSSFAMMMDVPQISVTPAQGQITMSQEQSVLNSMEQYKQYCHVAVVSDSLFMPPTNINFTDASKMIPSAIPTSASGSQPVVPSVNYQQYMQQYQNKMPQGY